MKDLKLQASTASYVQQELNKLIASDNTKVWRVSLSPWSKKQKRSLPANDVYYAWLPEISDCLAMLKTEARRFLKLTFGLDVLFTGDVSPKAQALYASLDKAGFFQWDYESRMIEMDQRQVTSIMTTEEHSQMREQMQAYFGLLGLNLDYK